MDSSVARPAAPRTLATIADRLLVLYGEFMSTEEVARELRLKTASGIRMARRRGRFPLKPLLLQNRRGHFYRTGDVAHLVNQALASVEEQAMET